MSHGPTTAADEVHQPAAASSPLAALRLRLPAEPDIPALVQALAEIARERIGAEAARVWLAAPFAAADPAAPVVVATDAALAQLTGRPELVAPVDLPPDSRLRAELHAAGAALVAPLVGRGALVGVVALGPAAKGLGEGERQDLSDLAAYAALAILAAHLSAEQAVPAAASDVEEWRIAREIQRGLLPKELPSLPGWEIRAHYQPARVLGGDLYDFVELPGGLLGIVFGDASDKSVPAALMMAAARTLLRPAAQRIVLPGQVLSRVNDALCAQNPPGNFVTCFYGILDPASGRLRFANAGQTPPYARTAGGARELRARGWPLGLMPDRTYEEQDTVIAPGETILFYSDGLVETHAPDGAMLGEERLAALVGASPQTALLEAVLAAQQRFAGPAWQQEDDLTLVTIGRAAPPDPPETDALQLLAEFRLPSVPGNERLALPQVEAAVRELALPPQRLECLRTAVAEAVMNATEHGNRNRPDLAVTVRMLASPARLVVRVGDEGGERPLPPPAPDLSAQLAGRQPPRGWGLFLIARMVDQVRWLPSPTGRTLELTLNRTAP